MRVHKRIIVQVAGTISALNTVGKWFVSLFFFILLLLFSISEVLPLLSICIILSPKCNGIIFAIMSKYLNIRYVFPGCDKTILEGEAGKLF